MIRIVSIVPLQYITMHYNAALSEPNPEVDQSENILVTAQPRPGGGRSISQLWGENWYNLCVRPAVDFNPGANL